MKVSTFCLRFEWFATSRLSTVQLVIAPSSLSKITMSIWLSAVRIASSYFKKILLILFLAFAASKDCVNGARFTTSRMLECILSISNLIVSSRSYMVWSYFMRRSLVGCFRFSSVLEMDFLIFGEKFSASKRGLLLRTELRVC
jgi:hypothetical protein